MRERERERERNAVRVVNTIFLQSFYDMVSSRATVSITTREAYHRARVSKKDHVCIPRYTQNVVQMTYFLNIKIAT